MTRVTFVFLDDLGAESYDLGLEMHPGHGAPQAVSKQADRIDCFAVSPLPLHGAYRGYLTPLATWFSMRLPEAIAVLDTHHGIGGVDAVAEAGPGAGLLWAEPAAALFTEAMRRREGRSFRASVVPQFAMRLHQINAGFFSAIAENAEALVAQRAIRLDPHGHSPVYSGGLLGLSEDAERFEAAGVRREINRSVLSARTQSVQEHRVQGPADPGGCACSHQPSS